MIESEEKRIKLTDKLERWAEHTKANQVLRPGDIPGLVHSILEEFYHIHACCGHMVREQNELYDFTIKENICDDDGCSWEDVSGCYCKDCFEEMKQNHDVKGYPIEYSAKCPICGNEVCTFPSEGLVESNEFYCDGRSFHVCSKDRGKNAEHKVNLSDYGLKWQKVPIYRKVEED
jgi:hypothetical protein